jgi:ADP-ribosylglycohydrolase
MTICIAEVAATGIDLRSREALDEIGEHFLDWYRRGAPGIGATTRSVLASAPIGADLPAAAVAYHARTGRSASNGALMRTAPVALAHLGDDEAVVEAAISVALLTHTDPLAGQSCAIWCIAIDRAIRMDRLDGAWDALDLLPTSARDGWWKILEEAKQRAPEAFPQNWHSVGCLQAALAAVLSGQGRSLEEGLKAAVKAGGDTDTVATVAGALLGARWGAAAVPDGWRSALHDSFGRTGEDLVQLGCAIAQARARRAPPSAATGYVE